MKTNGQAGLIFCLQWGNTGSKTELNDDITLFQLVCACLAVACVRAFHLKNKTLISSFGVKRYFVKHQSISHNIWCFSNRILKKQNDVFKILSWFFHIYPPWKLLSRLSLEHPVMLPKLFSNLKLRQIRSESKLTSANQSRRSVTHDISKQEPPPLPMIVF